MEAIEKSSEAFQQYRNKSGKEKADFLEEIAEEILALRSILITRATEESDLPESRLTGERGRTVAQLRLFAQLLREGSWVDARIDTAHPGREPIPRPEYSEHAKSLGVGWCFWIF